MKVFIISWSRFFGGLIFAPLVTLYLIPLANCAIAPITGSSNCWAGVTGFTWYGLPIVGIAIIAALPFSFFVLRMGWIGGKQVVGAGILIALSLAVGLALIDNNLNPVALVLGLVPLGAIAAFIFWLVGIRRNAALK